MTTKVKKVWKCPLCGISYIVDGKERSAVCIWVHIFRKDKHFLAISERIKPPHTPKRPVSKSK